MDRVYFCSECYAAVSTYNQVCQCPHRHTRDHLVRAISRGLILVQPLPSMLVNIATQRWPQTLSVLDRKPEKQGSAFTPELHFAGELNVQTPKQAHTRGPHRQIDRRTP